MVFYFICKANSETHVTVLAMSPVSAKSSVV